MRASSGDGRHRKGMPTEPPHPRAAAARARAAAQRLRERRFSVVPASDRVLMLHFPVLAGLPSRPSRAKKCRPREYNMFAGSHNELERCAALLLPQKPGESWFRRCSRLFLLSPHASLLTQVLRRRHPQAWRRSVASGGARRTRPRCVACSLCHARCAAPRLARAVTRHTGDR